MASGFETHLNTRLSQLSNFVSSEITLESLVDSFVALYNDCKAIPRPTEHVSKFICKYDDTVRKLKRLRVNKDDFDNIKILATGAIGKVQLVKAKFNHEYYAMKVLKKSDLLNKREAAFFMEERNALALSKSSEWLTLLHAAFQDDENLYLVMEYACGGSLRSLINQREEGMPEIEAKFYIAELLMGLNELHGMKFIHRDVKPENCLIMADGHVKLADFGSCTFTDNNQRLQANETVGTPDYISPEILTALEGKGTYGPECDWWSVGIILFELLYDEPPFYADSLMETYSKIMNHERHFEIPDDVEVMDECIDMLRKLICKKELRLGRNGAKEIMAHPWFSDIDFANIRKMTPPFIPQVEGPNDTRYFDDEDESKNFGDMSSNKPKSNAHDFHGNSLPFVGYTFLNNSDPKANWMKDESSTTNSIDPKKLEELNEMKRANELLEKEKASLDNKVLQLKKAADQKSLIENELQMLQEAQKNLESQNKSLKDKYDKEVATSHQWEVKVAEMSKEKVILETEMKDIRQCLNDNLVKQEDIKKTYDDLLKKKLQVDEQRSQLETKNEHLSQKISVLEQEIQQLNLSMDTLKKTKTQLSDSVASLEKEKKMLSLEVTSLQNKLQEVQTEKSSLKQTIANLEQNHSQEDDTRSKINALTAQRDQTLAELESLGKTLALKDLELSEIHRKLETELQQSKSSSDRVLELEKRFEGLSLELESAKSSKSQQDHLVQSLKNDNSKLSEEISRMESTQSSLSLQRAELEKAKAGLQQELLTANTKITDLKKSIDEKNALIETSAAELFEEKTKASRQLFDSSEENRHLKEEIARLSQLIAGLNSDLSSKVREYEDKLSAANVYKVEYEKELQAKNQLEDLIRTDYIRKTLASQEFETLRLKMNAEIESLKKQATKLSLPEERSSDALASPGGRKPNPNDEHFKFGEPPADTSSTSSLTRKSTQKHIDLEKVQNKDPHILSDDFKQPSFTSLNDLSSIAASPKNRNTRASMLFSKMDTKSPEGQNILRKMMNRMSMISKADQEKVLKQISDAEDDMKQKNSSKPGSPMVWTSKRPSSDLTAFNASIPLVGILKVPKSGGLRKGWKQVHAVFRDFKIYVYEKEKDMDGEGAVLVDLRSEIFYARTVAQAELIHASSKEIECIFKIQTGTFKHRGSASMISFNTTERQSGQEIQKRIGKLQSEIAFEEKMYSATEKILQAHTEDKRIPVIQQLELSAKRISALKMDLKKLEEAKEHQISESVMKTGIAKSFSIEKFGEEELNQCVAILDQTLATQTKLRNELLRTRGGKEDDQILELTANVIRLEGDLEAIRLRDSIKIPGILERLNENKPETNGHEFKAKKSLFNSADCYACHEAIWSGHAMECSICKVPCHKQCKQLVDIKCSEYSAIKMKPAVFLMGADVHDRNRWLAGLEHYRREFERQVPISAHPSSTKLSDLARSRQNSRSNFQI